MSRSKKDSIHAPAYRARFLVIVVFFSLFLSGIGLGLGERILREERAASVREVNTADVRALASEAAMLIRGAADRLKGLARLTQTDELAESLRTDPDIVSLTIYSPTARADYWEPRVSALNPEFSKLYGFTPKSLEKLRRAIPVPFARVTAAGVWLVSAAADADAPLATLAVSLGSANGDAVAVADLRTERWAARTARKDGDSTELYLVDFRGNAIAHPDLRTFSRRFAAGEPPLASMPLVRSAFSAVGDDAKFQSESFEWNGRRWLGASAASDFGGVRAVAQISESDAFAGVERFRRHAALLALLGVTLAVVGAAWLVRNPVSADSGAGPKTPILLPAPADLSPPPAINHEFLELLLGFRARIEQIRARATEPLEGNDPELLRAALLESGKRLENLGEQAAWAAEIFRKLHRKFLESEQVSIRGAAEKPLETKPAG